MCAAAHAWVAVGPATSRALPKRVSPVTGNPFMRSQAVPAAPPPAPSTVAHLQEYRGRNRSPSRGFSYTQFSEDIANYVGVRKVRLWLRLLKKSEPSDFVQQSFLLAEREVILIQHRPSL